MARSQIDYILAPIAMNAVATPVTCVPRFLRSDHVPLSMTIKLVNPNKRSPPNYSNKGWEPLNEEAKTKLYEELSSLSDRLSSMASNSCGIIGDIEKEVTSIMSRTDGQPIALRKWIEKKNKKNKTMLQSKTSLTSKKERGSEDRGRDSANTAKTETNSMPSLLLSPIVSRCRPQNV